MFATYLGRGLFKSRLIFARKKCPCLSVSMFDNSGQIREKFIVLSEVSSYCSDSRNRICQSRLPKCR